MARNRLAIHVALCAALLASCGSDETGEAEGEPTISVPPNLTDPATGPTVKTGAYSFRVPQGWKQRRDPSRGEQATLADVAVIDAKDTDDFTDNLTISEQPELAEFADIEALAQSAEAGLSINSGDATGVAVGKPIDMDGAVAATVIATLKDPRGRYDIVQYYVPRDDTGYVITFSFSVDKPLVDQRAVAQAVAASWQWADSASAGSDDD